MKKGVIVFVALLFFSLIGFVYAQQYYDDYSDVLLVCNANSSDSQSICSYFIQQRTNESFSLTHIVNLTNVSTAETISDAEFEKIYTQVSSKLSSVGEINYIVTTTGVPLRTSNKSVDSKLMARLGATSNYYSSEDVFTHEAYGGYLITRLTGYNVADAKRLIDNSGNANLTGKFLLNKYSTSYSFYDMGITNAYNLLTVKGYSAELNNSVFVRNRNNLSGYWSWGSNAGCGINCQNSSAWNLSFNPGAIGETAVSTSAWTFGIYPWNGSGPYGGQSLILDLIHYNITGIRGYVYEPYLDAVVSADALFDRYTDGYNLADTYYMSSFTRDWMDVVVGDPKTHVVESSSSLAPVVSLRDLLDGERINNGTDITFTVYLSKFYGLDSLWYSMDSNPTNTTISTDSYTINTSGWSYGNHTINVYANDSHGSESSKTFTFTINTTIGETPKYSYFNGNRTTDIKVLADKTNVSGLVLEKEMAGRIDFLSNLSVSGLDLNSLVQFSDGRKVSINSSLAPSLNVPANVTLYNTPGKSYANPVILRDGQICNRTTSPACYNFTALNASEVKFNVSSWSTYEISGNLITGCTNITSPGVYTLVNDLNTSQSNCFLISSDNVTLNGQGHLINRTSFGTYTAGVYSEGIFVNVSILNLSVTNFYTGVYLINFVGIFIDSLNVSINLGYGGVVLDSCSNITIQNSNFTNNGDNGVNILRSGSNILLNNLILDNNTVGLTLWGDNILNFYLSNILSEGNEEQGLDLSDILGGSIENVTIDYNGEEGLYLDLVNTTFKNITASFNNVGIFGTFSNSTFEDVYSENNSVYGIAPYSSSNNYFRNVTIIFSGNDGLNLELGDCVNNSFLVLNSSFNGDSGISLFGDGVNSNNFSEVFVNYNNGGIFLSGNVQENYFFNLNSKGNSFSSVDEWMSGFPPDPNPNLNNYFSYNSSFGRFVVANENVLAVSVIAGNLSFPGNINLSSNYIYVNSTALPELNGSANLTFYFSPNEFSIPYIAKDSVACTTCHNFTSLTSNAVEFNVSSFSAYSLRENDTTKPSLNYSSMSVTNQSVNVSFNVSDNGRLNNCTLTVGALSNSTSNFSNPNSLFFSGLSADTTYTATLSCYDYADNSNSTSFSFTTDANPVAESHDYSGGSYSVPVSQTALNSGATQSLFFGMKLTFSYNSESHSISLNKINRTNSEALIDVYSVKQTISLKLNESKEIDLNGDGKVDVKITLLKVYNDSVRVDLKIELISSNTFVNNLFNNNNSNNKSSCYAQGGVICISGDSCESGKWLNESSGCCLGFCEEDLKKEKSSVFWVVFIVVLVLILAVLAVMWKKKWSHNYRYNRAVKRIKYSSKY